MHPSAQGPADVPPKASRLAPAASAALSRATQPPVASLLPAFLWSQPGSLSPLLLRTRQRPPRLGHPVPQTPYIKKVSQNMPDGLTKNDLYLANIMSVAGTIFARLVMGTVCYHPRLLRHPPHRHHPLLNLHCHHHHRPRHLRHLHRLCRRMPTSGVRRDGCAQGPGLLLVLDVPLHHRHHVRLQRWRLHRVPPLHRLRLGFLRRVSGATHRLAQHRLAQHRPAAPPQHRPAAPPRSTAPAPVNQPQRASLSLGRCGLRSSSQRRSSA